MSELSETAQKRKAKAAIQKRKAKAAARFDPARFGKKKELKRLDLREFEELNLSPNGIVIMLLESSARKAAQYKECSAMRAGVEREMRNLRAQKAELVAQRMGLRKFKQKKGGAGTALPTLPPVLRRALEPAPGPATLKRDAGTGAGPLPAPPPRELARQRAAVAAGGAAVGREPALPASVAPFADGARWTATTAEGGKPKRMAPGDVRKLADALPLPWPLVKAMNTAACDNSAGGRAAATAAANGLPAPEPLHAAAAPVAELQRIMSPHALLHTFERDSLDPYGVSAPWLRGEANWRDGSRRMVWGERARFPMAGLVHVPPGSDSDGVDPALAAARRALERKRALVAEAKAAGFESVEAMHHAREVDGEVAAARVIQRPWKQAVMRLRVLRNLETAKREAARKGSFDWASPWYRLEAHAAAELAQADAAEEAAAAEEAEAEREWRAKKDADARELAASRAAASGWESPTKGSGAEEKVHNGHSG